MAEQEVGGMQMRLHTMALDVSSRVLTRGMRRFGWPEGVEK